MHIKRLCAEREDVATRCTGVCAGEADVVSVVLGEEMVASKSFLLSSPSAR